MQVPTKLANAVLWSNAEDSTNDGQHRDPSDHGAVGGADTQTHRDGLSSAPTDHLESQLDLLSPEELSMLWEDSGLNQQHHNPMPHAQDTGPAGNGPATTSQKATGASPHNAIGGHASSAQIQPEGNQHPTVAEGHHCLELDNLMWDEISEELFDELDKGGATRPVAPIETNHPIRQGGDPPR